MTHVRREDYLLHQWRLPDHLRTVGDACIVRGLTQSQAAFELNSNTSTIYNRLRRIRRVMPHLLEFPAVTQDQLAQDLPFLTQDQRQILEKYFHYFSQTEICKLRDTSSTIMSFEMKKIREALTEKGAHEYLRRMNACAKLKTIWLVRTP